ncbi:IS21 family transposase [bacterium]|nr:IS21 family transposase [bacterium]
MEFWTEVRRQVLVEGLSKRGAVKKYKIGWHTLNKILALEEPPGYRQKQPRAKPKIEAFLPIIAGILKADQKAPRKQRHSAKRIFERLKKEHGFTGGCTIVKDAVRVWRQSQKEVFLPLVHRPGEAQVDYGFAQVQIRGHAPPIQVAIFVMTLPYSGVVFCQVFHRECTESFQEGHRRAFEFFGGVPWRISYDNSKVAVAKIVGSRDRKLTREFLRLQSHYLFAEHFCLVRRPNEKGHVERLVEYARSNFLVPVPVVDSLEELNQRLLHQCRVDLENQSRGKSANKRLLLEEERSTFLALPKRPFEARRITQAAVSSQSLVRFDRNSYSVPTKYAHRKVTVVGTVDEVRFVFGDSLIARHQRCWDKEQFFYQPVHYLSLLERKPGGFDFAKPIEQWQLPECFGVLRRRLEASDPKHGTRDYIRVLRLLERHPRSQLTDAIGYALDIDVVDPDSIRVILEHRSEKPTELFSLDGRPQLKPFNVETTDVSAYAALLSAR